MENLATDLSVVGDLLELSPEKMPSSILKPSQKENLILLQTPIHKQLKVSFITPKRTPAMAVLQPTKTYKNSSVLTPIAQNVAPKPRVQAHNIPHGLETPKSWIKRGVVPRNVGVSSHAMDAGLNENNMAGLDLPAEAASCGWNTGSLLSFDDAICTVSAGSAKTSMASSDVQTSRSDAVTHRWDSLRLLDENSRWRDRVEVITKLDHKQNVSCARDCVKEIIEKAMNISESVSQQTTVKLQGDGVMTPMPDILTPLRPQNVGMSSQIGHRMTKTALPSMLETLTPLPSHNADITSLTTTAQSDVVSVPRLKVTVPVSELTATSVFDGTFGLKNERLLFGEDLLVPETNLNKNVSKSGNLPILPENNTLEVATEILMPTMAQTHGISVSEAAESGVFENKFPQNHLNLGPSPHSCDPPSISDNFDPFSPIQSSTTLPHRDVGGGISQGAVSGLSNAADTACGSVTGSNLAMRLVDVEFKDEDFVDSTVLLQQGCLDLDYLDKKTSGDVSAALRKQSLYVKFDPLLKDLDERRSIALLGRKSDIIDFTARATPISEDETTTPREPDLLCDSPEQIGTARSHMAHDSGNQESGVTSVLSDVKHSGEVEELVGIIEVLAYSEEDFQKILSQKEENQERERESSTQEQKELEKQIRESEIIMKERDQHISEQAMNISAEKARKEEESSTMRDEKLKISARISKLTKASSNLFQSTETLQKSLANYQANKLRQEEHSKTFREKLSGSQKKILKLENETAARVKKFKSEIEAAKTDLSAQLNNVQMRIKSAELRAKSLQSTVDGKKKENQELLKICDELMATNEPKRSI